MFEIVNAVISDPAELKWATNDIELRLQPELADRRFDGRDGAVYYPALSIPVGEEDELFCPPEHLAAARERLKSGDGLNLLVLGYSGLDQEVLRLLRESEAKVRSLFVVNGNERASLEAADRIMRAISGGTGVRADSVFAGGFTDAVKTGALGDFINSVSLN
jgi:hypothetical protein